MTNPKAQSEISKSIITNGAKLLPSELTTNTLELRGEAAPLKIEDPKQFASTKVGESEAVKKPTSLHLSFAKYGRVGKSTWLKLLIEYMLHKKKPHIIVDTDRETPNVARAYTPEILELWAGNKVVKDNESIDELLLDDLFTPLDTSPKTNVEEIDSLLAEQILFSDDNRTEYLTRNLVSLSKFGRDILVNLPANVYQPVCDFISTNNLHRSAKIQLFNWWVSNGSDESLELFLELQAKFPQAKHILVLNQGNFQYVYDWKRFQFPKQLSKQLCALYNTHQIKVVRMPFLSVEPSFWQSQEFVPYHKIVKDESIDEFVRDAIQVWTIKAMEAIEKTTWI